MHAPTAELKTKTSEYGVAMALSLFLWLAITKQYQQRRKLMHVMLSSHPIHALLLVIDWALR